MPSLNLLQPDSNGTSFNSIVSTSLEARNARLVNCMEYDLTEHNLSSSDNIFVRIVRSVFSISGSSDVILLIIPCTPFSEIWFTHSPFSVHPGIACYDEILSRDDICILILTIILLLII
jgi:hypothetical protein